MAAVMIAFNDFNFIDSCVRAKLQRLRKKAEGCILCKLWATAPLAKWHCVPAHRAAPGKNTRHELARTVRASSACVRGIGW